MATHDLAMADGPLRPDRRTNGSPLPAQSQSKRDKRRQMLADRLATLSERMAKDRDQAFREQLQKIQIDTSLVMRVDPYVDRPLDNFEEDQRKLQQANGDPDGHLGGPRSLLEMAGPKFPQWMETVQDLVEQRDYALTKYKVSHFGSRLWCACRWLTYSSQFDFEKKTSEIINTHAYKVETANREYRALSQTLRDRLFNAIQSKKFRLNKEKDAFEISDASALLLHPNQFSITNPASPGGTHSKRTTRLRREVDDMPSMDGRKRKRNNNNNDDDGSPAPPRRTLDPNNTTLLWQTDRLVNRKTTGPIYSIDKLFTDKELSMTYNAAAVGAHKYMLTHKPRLDEQGRPVSSPDGSESGGVDNNEDQEGSDSVPSAPMMERNVSHATRSARGGANQINFTDDKLMGLEALSNFHAPGNIERMLHADPKLPPTFPSTYVKGHTKQSDFNTPTALSLEDINADMMVMQALRQYDQTNGIGSNFSAENGSRKLLEAVAQPATTSKYVTYLQGNRPSENEVRQRLGLPEVVAPSHQAESAVPDGLGTPSKIARSGTPAQSPMKGLVGGPAAASALGGVSMSRQSSANGAPMSRSSSRKGRATRAG